MPLISGLSVERPVGRCRAISRLLVWAALVPTLLVAVLRASGQQIDLLTQLSAFTPYFAAWSLILLAAALSTRHRPALLGAGAAVVLLGSGVVPRALPDRDRGPRTGVPVRVLTANMLAGTADPATLVRLVRDEDVDVLALQEFTPAARSALDTAGLGSSLAYSATALPLSSGRFDTTGSAIYSRFPIRDYGVRLNTGGFQQVYGTVRPPGGVPLLVESAHPVAPHSLEVIGAWRTDLAGEPVPDPAGPPRILLGDFNATLDHEPLRALIRRGYRDAADVDGKGLTPTWGPLTLRPVRLVTIDHVLVDRRIGVSRVSIHEVPNSDHRAVLATLWTPRG